MNGRPLLVTVDVEVDKAPDWCTRTPLSFTGVRAGIAERLHPLCVRLGVEPTYLLSPEVLCHKPSMTLLRGLAGCELGTHLHGEYVAPAPAFAAERTDAMQAEYGSDLERDKLATLTALFAQQTGRAPRSFRAGRFGIGPHTGRHLRALGYLCDGSVTPHVLWTAKDGDRRPDFTRAREDAYFTSAHGDLLAPGDSPLLEIPVTIRARRGGDPLWFRPWYATREELLQLVDRVAAEEATPLCAMFHQVELVAGLSPYPQTDADVARYLDDLEAALVRALERGFVPMTMERAWRWAKERSGPLPHPVLQGSRGRRTRQPRLAGTAVAAAVARHAAPSWHDYGYRERATRWDVSETYAWLADHLPVDAAVLDVGCGVGTNLQYLADQGFTDLSGCDNDARALAAGTDLASEIGAPLRLWLDDGLRPLAVPDRRFDAIAALNWTHLCDGFDLARFLGTWTPRLQRGGYLVFDAIDRAFDRHPLSRWRTSDWNRPEAERAPSEYRHRFDRLDVAAAAAAAGLEIAAEIRREQTVSKAVYVLRKPWRARVLLVVDEPGWAHDHKARALQAQLGDEFDLDVRYQAAMTPADAAAADVVVVFYWLQIAGCAELREALRPHLDKLLLGVCSHAELQGEKRQEALALLRAAPAVFVHSELLRAEVAPLLREGQHLFCVPNGVDVDVFTPPRIPTAEHPHGAPLRVGWAGSLGNFGRELRGFDEIERTCAELPGVVFTPAVKERGQRRHGAMARYYHDVDAYVCMSRCEGTPNPALEAAACGVPLVTTRVGNMPEFVRDGENGFFVQRGDGSLAEALVRLRDDPALRQRMATAARTAALAWGWAARARAWSSMLHAALRGDPACAAATGAVHVLAVGDDGQQTRRRRGEFALRALGEAAGELRVPGDGSLARQLEEGARELTGWLLVARGDVDRTRLARALARRHGHHLVVAEDGAPFALVHAGALRPFTLCGGDAWDLQWAALGASLAALA